MRGETLTASEAEKLLRQTRWYFSDPVVAPKCMDGFEIKKFSRSQIRLVSNHGVSMIYEEDIPDRGMKAYRLGGKLKPLVGIDEPIFEANSVQRGDQKSLRLIGFLPKRIFVIQAKFSGEYDTALADAVNVATNMLHEFYYSGSLRIIQNE